ncbi:MAG: right-handed parallel beta-helix repeat-containing protein, partial [Planctomycetota bacterium]
TLIGTYTTTNNAFSVAGTTTLAGSTTVSTGGGGISFTGIVDGRTNLTLDAGGGVVAFSSAVGSKNPLGAIKVLSAGSFAAGGPLTLDGNFAGSGANGLEFSAGINAVLLTSGGTISGFSQDGILFGGSVTNSTVTNFTIQNNGGNGINLAGGDLTGTVIAANTIKGNGQSGIRVAGSNVLVGGAAGGNTIASNNGDGVLITGNTATNNSVLSNSIYLNKGLGIQLANGSNEVISAPVLTDGRIIKGTSLYFVGTMQSGGRPYRIQIFRNQPEDASTAGGYEGRTLVHEKNITDGATSFTDTFVADLSDLGQWYTATATYLDVGNNPFSTSAFSSGLRLSVQVVTTLADAGPGSLRQAMEAANAVPGNESIIFDIPSATPADLTILLTAPLPAVTRLLSIDGANLNRPGNLAASVSIDGQMVPGAANGLVFTATAAGSIVTSLGIANFTRGAGIFMAAARMDVFGNTLTNDSFGIRASGGLSGSQIRGNTISQVRTFGIYLASATGLTVGSTTVGQGNTVTGGTGRQVYSTGLYATGNLAGTRVIGNTFSGHAGSGVMLVNATGIAVGGTTAGAGNIITKNRAFGFYASGTSTGSSAVANRIAGNRVNVSQTRARSLAFR